jgi:hypothetical protein
MSGIVIKDVEKLTFAFLVMGSIIVGSAWRLRLPAGGKRGETDGVGRGDASFVRMDLEGAAGLA